MRGPGAVAALVARAHVPAAVLGVDGAARHLGSACGQQQRRVDFQVFEFDVLPILVPGLRRRQRHLGESGAREHHGLAHDVIGQRRMGAAIELVFPGRFMLAQRVAQQGMHAAALQQSDAGRRERMPMAFALPGVGWQLDMPARPREQRLPLGRGAAGHHLAGGVVHALRVVLAARRGDDDAAFDVGLLERIVDVAAHHRVRSDLDEDVLALFDERGHGLVETHWLAHVAPPVVGVQRGAGHACAGDGGIERDFRLAGRQAGQRFVQRAADAVHGGAVEGIVQVEPALEGAPLAQGIFQHRQRIGVAGDGGAAAAVVAGHAQHARQAQFGDQRQRGAAVHAHRGHGAAPARQPLQAAAMEDHLHGVGQRQRAAGPGGRDFADAVAGDRVRDDAALVQHAGHAHLHGEQRGLRIFGAVVAAIARGGAQRIAQQVAGQRMEVGVDLVHRFGEHRVVHQALAHAGPLRAIARVDEHRSLGGGHGAAAGDQPARPAFVGQGGQGLGDGFGSGAIHDGPLFVPVAAQRGLVGDIVEGARRLAAQVPRHVARGRLERGGLLAADDQRDGRGGGQCGKRRMRLVRRRLQDDVGIGAAEAERVHAHGQRAAFGQGAPLAHDVDVPGGAIDVGVDLVHADGGGHFPVAQAVQRLDQAGDPGGRFQVALVALDRTDGQRRVGRPLPAQRHADGAGFDGVAHRRAGAVRFQVIDLARVDAGLRIGLAQQPGLRVGAGHGQAGLPAVGVDGGARHHGQDGVAVGQGGVIVFEDEQAAAFGAHIAIGAGVEHAATAARRQHGSLGEGHEPVRVQVQADAAGHSHGGVAGGDGAACLVKGHQRRRARGVDGHAGAAQVEHVGQPVGGDAAGIAGGDGGIDHLQIVGQPVGIIRAGDADIYAAIAAAYPGRPQAGIFEAFPAQFQQQALLRIHQGCFAWRDTEEIRIEAGNVAERARAAGICGARMIALRVEIGIAGPARFVDLGDQILALEQVAPVIGGIGAGESERQSDDGNTLCH